MEVAATNPTPASILGFLPVESSDLANVRWPR